MKIYANWRQTGRTLFEITPQEETTIRQIAATTTQTATEARTLLYLRYGEEYPIDLPPLSELIDAALLENIYINFKGGAVVNSTALNTVGKPYPNPADNTLIFNYSLGEKEAATLTFYSINGAQMVSYQLTNNGTLHIPVNSWANGVYFYNILLSTGELIHGKLTVLR